MTSALLVVALLRPGPDVADLAQFRGLLAEAEAAYSAAESVCRVSRFHWEGGLIQEDEYTRVTDGLSYRLTVTARPGGNGQRPAGLWQAVGANPAYQFGLLRRGGEWWLESLGRTGDRPTDPADPADVRYYTELQLPFARGRATYRELLVRPGANPRFHPAVEWQGKVYPEWRFEESAADGRRLTVLLLDPDRPGLVRVVQRCDADDPGRVTDDCRLDYQESAARWPPPAKVERWADIVQARPRRLRLLDRNEVVEYRRLGSPPPPAEFTMSAFGLAEPTGLPPVVERYSLPDAPSAAAEPAGPQAETWQWWAIGGILAVGLVAFVWSGRRTG